MDRFKDLPREKLQAMAEAGQWVLECYRVLQKSADNLVGEVLRGHGTFYEMNHYPPGDVFDPENNSQYYYHSHRKNEHGHFHAFLRSKGMRDGVEPVEQSHEKYMDERQDNICHLIAISMDGAGLPIGLFTTNRWVTAENWYSAEDTIGMLADFHMDLVPPSWPVNIWMTNMVRLFAPDIADLIRSRDDSLAAWRQNHPDRDVFEDRELEVITEKAISVEKQITRINKALGQG